MPGYSTATCEPQTERVFIKHEIQYMPREYVLHWIKVNISHEMCPVSVLEALVATLTFCFAAWEGAAFRNHETTILNQSLEALSAGR